jgi:hypothetical protein
VRDQVKENYLLLMGKFLMEFGNRIYLTGIKFGRRLIDKLFF